MTTYRGAASAIAGTPYADKRYDTFTGDSSTVAFTLTNTPSSIIDIDIQIHGVYQNRSTYSFTGTTLTFTEAPPTATDNIEVTYRI